MPSHTYSSAATRVEDNHSNRHFRTLLHSDWWPPLLVAILLGTLWAMMIERAAHDDTLVIQEALINHQNVAQAMANHTGQMLDRLRFYGQTLAQRKNDDMTGQLVRSAVGQDRAFLRVMQFDSQGRLLFSTGPLPERWQLDAAKAYAAMPVSGMNEHFHIGSAPPAAFSQAWYLPLFYRPQSAGTTGFTFILALVDLGHFPRRFENMQLGKSGEIVLASLEGQEILRMQEGRLDFTGSIAGTERHRQAFSAPSGTLVERVRDSHDRLFAFRRIEESPFAILVSRTEYDVLLTNKSTQRGYWLMSVGMTLVMLFLTLFWSLAASRKRRLVYSLTQSQNENTRLIQQLEKEKQAAYRLATHDKLTGLANRMLFSEIAERYFARAKRKRSQFAIMFIDLDRFKPINDTHGHKAGDQLLVEVAERLQECVRQTDLVARFGGDEFVALISDLHGSHDATGIARKIIDHLCQPFTDIVTDDIFVSPSIGIALFPDDANEIDALIRQADAAMYQAKHQGRATFVFADPTLNRRNDIRSQIEAALPAALINREIHLHYQPKISLDGFGVVGFEALARWKHVQMGDVSPADFVPVAENSSLIVDLGKYVIEAACHQIAEWQLAGLKPVPVAVNISPRQLRSPQLAEFIECALVRHDLHPSLLEIEITETGLIDADENFIKQLNYLDNLGIHLAIDDFGTGFSGLSHLRALPVKQLKIDRSFIKNIRNDINDATIVSSIISLAHNLKLIALAEGVETIEQLTHLRTAGCDQVQGYLLSRPLPPEEATELLANPIIDIKLRRA